MDDLFLQRARLEKENSIFWISLNKTLTNLNFFKSCAYELSDREDGDDDSSLDSSARLNQVSFMILSDSWDMS